MCLAELSKLTYFSLHKAHNMQVCLSAHTYVCDIFSWTRKGISREQRGEDDGLQG